MGLQIHGFEPLETGEPDSFPATKPVPVYSVRVVDDDIVVDLEDDS